MWASGSENWDCRIIWFARCMLFIRHVVSTIKRGCIPYSQFEDLWESLVIFWFPFDYFVGWMELVAIRGGDHGVGVTQSIGCMVLIMLEGRMMVGEN